MAESAVTGNVPVAQKTWEEKEREKFNARHAQKIQDHNTYLAGHPERQERFEATLLRKQQQYEQRKQRQYWRKNAKNIKNGELLLSPTDKAAFDVYMANVAKHKNDKKKKNNNGALMNILNQLLSSKKQGKAQQKKKKKPSNNNGALMNILQQLVKMAGQGSSKRSSKKKPRYMQGVVDAVTKDGKHHRLREIDKMQKDAHNNKGKPAQIKGVRVGGGRPRGLRDNFECAVDNPFTHTEKEFNHDDSYVDNPFHVD